MNKSVDPCEDFYQFACGNFGKFHNITEMAFSKNRFIEAHITTLEHIRDFLKRDYTDNEPSFLSKSRLLYRSCIMEFTDGTNTYTPKPLVQVLDKIGLSFKVITNRQEASSLSTILARLKMQINSDYLFVTNVNSDTKNQTVNRISLGKPSDTNIFSLHKITENIKKISPRIMHETLDTKIKGDINNDIKNKYNTYNTFISFVMCKIYKLQSNRCKMYKPILKTKKISQISSFEEEYSKIINKIYDSDADLPSVMTVDELQNFTNNVTQNFTKPNEKIIDWKEYLTILFVDAEDVKLDFETDIIQLSNIEYFEALFKLISKHKDQFIINIWWEVVGTLFPFTTNEMRFMLDKFSSEATGLENDALRSLSCAYLVNSMMGLAISHVFLAMKPIYNNMSMVAEMLKNIHWAFKKIVEELNWMDDTTKQRTLYKAEKMRTIIGFPEFINDSKKLDDYYSEFEVVEDDFFGNIERCATKDLKNTFSKKKQLNDYIIDKAPNFLEVNAYNAIKLNAIVVPAGILQFPFIGHDLQMLNYGFFGFLLGHELTHGFDNIGRKFDQDGNENISWTNETIEEYEKRTDCFIQHYDSYLIPGLKKKMSGKKTLNENIADNGGLREALWAYRKFVNDNGKEPKLPGFEQYSNEQMYYLSFANNFCEEPTPDSLSKSRLDVHSPNSIRVIAGLTNSDEFSEVWNCKKGSKMNPENEKCKIW
ncbi:endothelin-converting enzyme homolog [Myzus persicae]|uniref:endothelin-converting enzyme homolog n=1 Tax=Myzus persicae TaxID=13164 RepID=UPI000B939F26|nr:endothelin-converting enzyme homolog [Myzus persicae]